MEARLGSRLQTHSGHAVAGRLKAAASLWLPPRLESAAHPLWALVAARAQATPWSSTRMRQVRHAGALTPARTGLLGEWPAPVPTLLTTARSRGDPAGREDSAPLRHLTQQGPIDSGWVDFGGLSVEI